MRIWKDKWLPRLSTFKMVSQVQLASLDENTHVRSLIDWSVGQWDSRKLQECLPESEVEIIRQVPICPRPMDEILVWHY